MVSVAVAVHGKWARIAFGGVDARPTVTRIDRDALAGPRLAATLVHDVAALRSLDATLRRAAISLVQRAAARLT
jgi:CO/xanthine dehydrogenase FAD-binding subunit